jgi:hypothetical protein
MQSEMDNYVWSGLFQVAEQVAGRLGQYGTIKKRVRRFPPLNVKGNWNNDRLRSFFEGPDDGRRLTEELLGLWLGSFDLLVIDEAHKSRGSLDTEGVSLGAVNAKVLTRLCDGVIRQSGVGRRLCLTATPMELDPSQWLDLLERARSGLDREKGERVIDDFRSTTKDAATAPDEVQRLDALKKAAQSFEAALKPYVTRRRRVECELIQRFRAKLMNGSSGRRPHPHRNVEAKPIAWVDTIGQDSPWLEVLFAAECMSQSACGLSLKDTEEWPRAVRDAYTKLQAGYVSDALLEGVAALPVPAPGVVDDHTQGKIKRAAYWYRRLREARKRVLEGRPLINGAEFDPDTEHPRILAAVKEIEIWTLKRQPEKVLVFGVFLRPLRLLRDVLNVRHALRAADASRPIAHVVHTDAALLGIAHRQLERLCAEGALTGRLSTGNSAKMRVALADSHKAYERLRDKVRRRAKKTVVAWYAEPSLLGGAPIERELVGALEDHLVSFVLDGFLGTTSESDEVSDERFDELTEQFVDERLRPLLGELGDEDIDEEQAALRQNSLRALLKDDDGRQSFYARLLQGDTRWETRRYLQAAFNRRGASPWVLIAQSQVGREGLNLHESCRVVVQFHAEWNPAVLEQQIGRVDRKGSLWEKLARQWLAEGALGNPPFVEVRQLIFEGTYDAFQWDRVMRRQHVFDASLFGSLLPADAWDRVPAHLLENLIASAPSFRPRITGDSPNRPWSDGSDQGCR